MKNVGKLLMSFRYFVDQSYHPIHSLNNLNFLVEVVKLASYLNFYLVLN